MQFDAAGRMYVSVGDGGGRGDPFDNARDVGSSSARSYAYTRGHQTAGRTCATVEPLRRQARGEHDLLVRTAQPGPLQPDRRTRHIAIGDVGQHLYEEVDYATLRSARGANFGWPEFEGFHDYDPSRPGPTPAVDPTFEYLHRDPGGALPTVAL